MAFKIFLDANILLDFTLKRDGYENARELIVKAIDGEIEIYTSPAVLHITSYWLSRSYNTSVAKEITLNLLSDVRIIDCDHSTAINALNSSITDVEDALQYYTALKNQLDYFISSDKKLKRSSIPQLPVMSVKEFLNYLKE